MAIISYMRRDALDFRESYPVRSMVTCENNADLCKHFQTWSEFVAPVGKKPSSYNENWCVQQLRFDIVCGGIKETE